jgi:putative ABC transport system permease protein
MNIMLVSVSERVREIGVRRALGASPKDVRSQFLVESALLSGAGGAIGVALGLSLFLGASVVIGKFLPTWITAVSAPSVVIALLISVAVGVVFGFSPARRASELNVVEAIRR